VAGVIPKEEKETFALESKGVYAKEVSKSDDPNPGQLWTFVINRVRDCLHVVLSFSPVGTKFRERARKFPALFSACTVDWFLPWPEEALVSVSHHFLASFHIDTTTESKEQLEKHMGKVHDMVNNVCEIYFQKMRRHVYVTPKSYLSFIELYKNVYKTKFDGLVKEEEDIKNGLFRLKEASDDVEKLKVDLKIEDAKLREATEQADKTVQILEVENKKANIKGEEVEKVKESCQVQKEKIAVETEEAQKDLEAALPYLRKAEAAVKSIRKGDIDELRNTRQPQDICRVIMDAVHILFQLPLVSVTGPRTYKVMKDQAVFIQDSFDEYAKPTLQS